MPEEENSVGRHAPEGDVDQVDPDEIAANMRSAVARLRGQVTDVYNMVVNDHPRPESPRNGRPHLNS
ncbi:hypothetical protein AB5J62_16545 [Amycolatopsis sp. cg5]|uniref:hypothetical protein n=1 Tax=Amycolatopsis sp. cg5 TaxID=3238802 RepID=UPI00352615FB